MKLKVYSSRKGMLTLHGEGARVILNPGMNIVDGDAWGKVKKHASVENLLKSKAVEEKGEVKEKAKVAPKPVADAKPVLPKEEK